MFETETWGRTTTNPVVTRAGASHYEMDTLEPEAVATSECVASPPSPFSPLPRCPFFLF